MSVEFEKVRIGDLGKVVTGKTPPTAREEYFGADYPFITPTDIDGSKRHVETERHLSQDSKKDFGNYLLPSGAICFVCIGATIGKVCITKVPSFTNQQINSIIPDSNRCDNCFIYYLLSTKKEDIKNIAGGAATPIVSKSIFCDVFVEIPELIYQQKIAAILSAYDELIENNLRRIKILEEMAQGLYREWFVKFRFPGHQKVKMVNSPLGKIPEGWTISTLGSLADLAWGDTSVTKESYVSKGYDAYSASGLDGRLEYFDHDRDGIVLSAIGANCGETWFAKGKWSCIKNTIRFWATSPIVSTGYLFFVTKGKDFWPRRGSAQPFISQGDARGCSILVPPATLMSSFTTFANCALDGIDLLKRLNQNLRETRDLLLPKLISGELDVSELDIVIPEGNA